MKLLDHHGPTEQDTEQVSYEAFTSAFKSTDELTSAIKVTRAMVIGMIQANIIDDETVYALSSTLIEMYDIDRDVAITLIDVVFDHFLDTK